MTDAIKKTDRDIKTYVKGFFLETNTHGLQMSSFYAKCSAIGTLKTYLDLSDDDVHATATKIATDLTNVLDKFKKSPSGHKKNLNSVTRSEFQKMFAMDIFTLVSRHGFDNLMVEAIEFFTQLFLNSFVEQGLLKKEITTMRRGNDKYQKTIYSLGSSSGD